MKLCLVTMAAAVGKGCVPSCVFSHQVCVYMLCICMCLSRYNELLFIIDTCQGASMYERFYSPNLMALASSQVGEDSLSVSHV